MLLQTARKDLRRRAADPFALAIWVSVPILIGTLIGSLNGDGGVAKAKLLVADLDGTLLSRLVSGTAGFGDVIDSEKVELAAGRARLDAGEASALLVLPAGFQKAVLGRETARLSLVTNPAQRILPGIVEETLDILLEALFYGQQIFDERDAAAIQGRIDELQDLAFPPVLQLEPESAPAATSPFDNLGQLFLPGFLFMSVIFVAQGMSDDVWTEKQNGTLARLVATPTSLAAFLAGKMLAVAVIVALVAAVGVGIGVLFFGFPPLALPLAVLWCSYSGTALLTLFFTLQTVSGSARGGNLLSNMVLFPLIMAGGSFFPFAVMPDWMRAVGAWTPNGMALLQLEDLLFGGATLSGILVATATLGATSALLFWLCARRLGGRFLQA